MIRSINDEELLAVVQRSLGDALRRGTKDVQGSVLRKVTAYLHGRPELPELLGVTEAAEVLGIRKPHVYRMVDQGRLSAALALKGGQVFLGAPTRTLAAELEAERAGRTARREARDLWRASRAP